MFRLPIGTVRARGPVQAPRLGGLGRCSIRRPSRAGPCWRSALVTASQMVKIGQVVGAAGEAAPRPYTAWAIHPRCAEHLPRFGAIAPVSSGPDPPARQGRELSGSATMTVARRWSMPLRRPREMGCARVRWARQRLAPAGDTTSRPTIRGSSHHAAHRQRRSDRRAQARVCAPIPVGGQAVPDPPARQGRPLLAQGTPHGIARMVDRIVGRRRNSPRLLARRARQRLAPTGGTASGPGVRIASCDGCIPPPRRSTRAGALRDPPSGRGQAVPDPPARQGRQRPPSPADHGGAVAMATGVSVTGVAARRATGRGNASPLHGWAAHPRSGIRVRRADATPVR